MGRRGDGAGWTLLDRCRVTETVPKANRESIDSTTRAMGLYSFRSIVISKRSRVDNERNGAIGRFNHLRKAAHHFEQKLRCLHIAGSGLVHELRDDCFHLFIFRLSPFWPVVRTSCLATSRTISAMPGSVLGRPLGFPDRHFLNWVAFGGFL